jgi:hypothetical protein
VRATIDQHVDRDRLARLRMVEKEERRMLEIFAVQASGVKANPCREGRSSKQSSKE